jgi:4-hydroxyphenylpyruvate dioxygenase
VQVADAPRIDMDLLHWSRHFRNMPGEGDLPVSDFVRAVAATGYDGPLSLEIFNDQFRGGSPKAIAVDGHRSLTYLVDQVVREEPALELGRPLLPPRIEVKGVEFVEFATDEAGARPLVELLRSTGFSLAGRHRSKDVTLYRQGAINLVVNTEQDGLAHSVYVTHGTTAYAIGLRVEDAAATVVRAEAMGAQFFEQPVAVGELKIPAIRGVGGGIIYFIDEKSELSRVWEIEFEPSPEVGHVDGGLMQIDHVAQTMNYEEMLTWVLFYVSIFATFKSPMVDVLDPAGIVRSQVIENSSGSLRLTLNGADNNRTIAGRFVKETFGSSVQHLAFLSRDIFASAASLRELGFRALVIPANYYDDLAARFGLGEALVEHLQLWNVLYDRDENGEFFQLYSHTFGEGFFFEIVERRGGYKGYGGPNAPFRIAAQKLAMKSLSEAKV